jgi:hypothetical protein
MTYLKRILLTAVLMVSLPPAVFARENIKFDLPEGWINVTEKIKNSDTAILPKVVVLRAQGHGASERELFMVDSKTLQDKILVFMSQDNVKSLQDAPQTHEFLAKVKKGFEDSLRKWGTTTLVEDGIVTLNGAEFFRSVFEGKSTGKEKANGSAMRILQYTLPDGTGYTLVTFGAPKAQWEKYLPVFEGLVSKALK